MTSIFEIILFVLGIAKFLIFAHVIMSWLINFQVLNLHQPVVAQIWHGINRILDPIYAPIRNILPNFGGIDLTPVAVLIGIHMLQIVVSNNLYGL